MGRDKKQEDSEGGAVLNSYYIAKLPSETIHPISFPGRGAKLPTFSSGGQWVGGTQIPLRDPKIFQGIWIWRRELHYPLLFRG